MTAAHCRLSVLAVTAALLLLSGAWSPAATYHVALGGSDGNSGADWANALATIGAGVAEATTPGDVVMVSNGTYNITSQIMVSNAVTVTSTNGPAATAVHGNASGRCFYISNVTAVVSGLTIENGKAPNHIHTTPNGGGGGVFIYQGTVSNCTLRGNSSGYFASAVQIIFGTLTGCTITNNANSVFAAVGFGNDAQQGSGIVRDCLISGNTGNYSAGIDTWKSTALIENCTITLNSSSASSQGAGVNMYSGGDFTLRNCLIAGNQAVGGAGGAKITKGVVENCTIANNANVKGAHVDPGGLETSAGVTVRNCIVYHNTGDVVANRTVASPALFTFSCTTPHIASAGNLSSDPQLSSPARQNYHLRLASPCIDAGTNQASMSSATDLDGNPRIKPVGGTNDMGCYEFTPGPLFCAVDASATTGIEPLEVVFSGYAEGANLGGLDYHWAFTNAAVIDIQGSDKHTVTNTFYTGAHTITLTVTNNSGEASTDTVSVAVGSLNTYVAQSGLNSATPPYSTWATASSNIQDAVDVSALGTTVWVSNGTYNLSSQIQIWDGIHVRSVNGTNATTVYGNAATRCFLVAHSNAVVDGFTITNGRDPIGANNATLNGGGGVLLYDGTVENCTITGNYGGYFGGGAQIVSGTMRNCVISGNSAASFGGGINFCSTYDIGSSVVSNCVVSGNTAALCAGVHVWDGTVTVQNCRVTGNSATGVGGYGGAVGDRYYGTMTMRNCLIAGNSAQGGTCGLITKKAIVENCTISANSTQDGTKPAGIETLAATAQIRNTIVYGNVSGAINKNHLLNTPGQMTFSCTVPGVASTGNTTNNPQMTSSYRILQTSPCVDTGTNLAWALLPGAIDLTGGARINNGLVDMGAYEYTLGSLLCVIEASDKVGIEPHAVTFTAVAQGQNTNGLYYKWAFTNAAVIDAQGAGKRVVTNTYGIGVHTATLTVSNSLGEVAMATEENITVGPSTVYVARAGWNSDQFPYTSWATAASNLQAAASVGVNGTEVIVTNGTYPLTDQLAIWFDMNVHSVNGRNVTTVQGNGTRRCFYVGSSNAVVDGFTIRNGKDHVGGTGSTSDGGGGGMFLLNGTVRNCTFTGNSGGYFGGGMQIMSGLVEDCIVTNNKATTFGGGINFGNTPQAGAATVRNCLISDNSATLCGGVHLWDGTIAMENCTMARNTSLHTNPSLDYGCGLGDNYYGTITLRNCLISDNRATEGTPGVKTVRAIIENCTIAGNSTSSATQPGGLRTTAATATMQNLVLYGNVSGSANDNYTLNDPSKLTYSCTTPLVASPGNIADDPLFVDAANGVYTLAEGSPCVNTGTNLSWMLPGTTDLIGAPRIATRRVDMGAFEFIPSPGTVFLIR